MVVLLKIPYICINLKIMTQNKQPSNRGRRSLPAKEKREPITVFIPLKHHVSFKKEIEPIIKKYLLNS